jgi:hypothetical protein
VDIVFRNFVAEKWTSCLAICLRRRELCVWRFGWEVDVTIGDSVEEQRISCSTISLRRSGRYGGDLIEEKWILYLAILLRRNGCRVWRSVQGEENIVFGDLFEENWPGHYD